MNSFIRSAQSVFTALPPLSLLLLLAGCGGSQGFGGVQRDLGGDLSSGYNTPLGTQAGSGSRGRSDVNRGTYPMIETSFRLPNLSGDPFDYEQNSVMVTLRKPDGGTVDIPAFFDGDSTWRMRYTPTLSGQYSVAGVKFNRQIAREEKLETKEWNVSGEPKAGFVRIDRGDKTRFVFDNGGRYYPLGHNQGWRSNGLPDIPDLFVKMGAAGENWSRVWMTHFDGKNLDWSNDSAKSVKPGAIDFTAAKRWDKIVEAAGKNGLYLQMVLQHHGQFSSEKGFRFSNNNNANWESNPWNVKNGGFLQSPEDFFTNAKARALTKRKFYYILARWGYSPNILAWELFNEVEGTDAGNGKLWDDIAMWHREMALFVRQYDGYHHLITTSSAPGIPLESPLWETVDYAQRHLYPPSIMTALGGDRNPSVRQKRPDFVGEFGVQGLTDPEGVGLHIGLWVSLMTDASGAAQYWSWDGVEQQNLYSHFKAVSGFLTASGMGSQNGLIPTVLPVETPEKSDLRFGPAGGWGKATQSEFVVGNGTPPGIASFPSYLQGTSKRAMMPKPLTFQVRYPQAGTFTVTVGQIAKAGTKLTVKVGEKIAERVYPADKADYMPKSGEQSITVAVPAGMQTISIENTGSDWLVVKEFAFSDQVPALASQARIGKEFAAVWVYHRGQVDAVSEKAKTLHSGKLNLTGLKPGRYRATWWDTREGKSLETTDVTIGKEAVTVETPRFARDVALYVTKANTPPAVSKNAKREKETPTEKGGTK